MRPNNSFGVDRRRALGIGAGMAAGLAGLRPARAATTLTLWTGYPELVPYFKAIGEAYAKTNPGFVLDVLSSSLREAEQKLSAALPTGTGPDIFDCSNAIAIKFIGAGLLTANPPEVEQYLKSGAWDPFTVQYFTIDGKTYGLPLLEGRASMFYNKTMLAEAGITTVPTTFPALMDAAVKLTRRDGTGKMTRSGISMRLSGQGSGITDKFRFVLEPAGGELLKSMGNGKWRNGFDNDAGRGALQFYVDVVQNQQVDDPRFPHDADAFATGQTAFLFREAWVIGDIKKKNPSLDYGVAPIPRWAEGTPYKGFVQPWGIFANSGGGRVAEARAFLAFLTEVQNAFQLTAMTGWGSPRKGIDWQPILKDTPQFDVFLRPPAEIVPYTNPMVPVFDEISTRMAERLATAFVDPALGKDKAKVAEAISTMAAQADRILKQADLYA